jgi:hypothetical protein
VTCLPGDLAEVRPVGSLPLYDPPSSLRYPLASLVVIHHPRHGLNYNARDI